MPTERPNLVAPRIACSPLIDRRCGPCKYRRTSCLDCSRLSFDRILLFSINRGMASDQCD
jgi:hypothetical protein